MKTTMNIPDPLYAALKERSAAQGRTVTSIVEQAIRVAMSTTEPATSTSLPTWHGGSADGYLVDLADSHALWDALDAEA